MRRFRWAHHLKTSLWLVPLLFVLGAIVLALATTAAPDDLVPESVTGDTTAALQILYLIAFAMLTLTGLVLSLVVVVVQLSMGVFSPRIVRQILHDRPSQCAIGLFAGTFTHALLSLRSVRSGPDGSVPGLAVLVAVVLVLACIVTLVWYINHIGQSLRVAALVGWVADDTLRTLDRTYPDRGAPQELAPDLVRTARSGVLFAVDHAGLVRIARAADVRLELLWAVGDFVPTGSALVRVVGDPSRVTAGSVQAHVARGAARPRNHAGAYGRRLLVDSAERCLSSGPFQDPTTAVQAVDRLHDLLRHVVRRPLHDGLHRDEAGTVRLVAPTLQWDGYVRLAFDEVRQAGAGSPQVARRLRAALLDLLEAAPEDRRPPLRRQLRLLDELAGRGALTAEDREANLLPDPSGLGSSDDLVAVPRQDAPAQQGLRR